MLVQRKTQNGVRDLDCGVGSCSIKECGLGRLT